MIVHDLSPQTGAELPSQPNEAFFAALCAAISSESSSQYLQFYMHGLFLCGRLNIKGCPYNIGGIDSHLATISTQWSVWTLRVASCPTRACEGSSGEWHWLALFPHLLGARLNIDRYLVAITMVTAVVMAINGDNSWAVNNHWTGLVEWTTGIDYKNSSSYKLSRCKTRKEAS